MKEYVVAIFVHRNNTKTLSIPFAGVKIGVQVEISYLKGSL